MRLFLPILFAIFLIPAAAQVEPRKLRPTDNASDAKHRKSGKAEPEADPSLAGYGIFEDEAPLPEKGAAQKTSLPLELAKGDRIALVGNTLLERGGHFGWFESMLYTAHPELDLVIRNLSWSADEIDLQPRPENFATVAQYLTRERVDVIIAAFGFNESFGGEEKLADFKERLHAYLAELKTSAFNGKAGPRILLLSPIANENTAQVPAADLNNERLALYTEAMSEVAAAEGVGFVDVFTPMRDALDAETSELTINGAHLTEEGYEIFAEHAFRQIFGESPPAIDGKVRDIVIDLSRQYARRYRPVNSFYYTGGRSDKYGYLDFLPAMRNFEMMTANREATVHRLVRGEDAKVDDSNIPPLGEVIEALGANEWLSPADEQAAFQVDPRFDVNLFASEEDFTELACPIQMRWDGRGRLWVSCSTTYPHVYPGNEPDDKIIILEDTDKDGRADKSTVFAEDLHIPLSFVLTEKGVYVSEQPDLVLLEDLDGDDKADRRTRVLTGFGMEDSHHSLHDFVWTPGGDLLFRESIFHNSQVETPYGPVRAKNSAWFQFSPETQKLVTFGNYPNTNPWGVIFDEWGNHVASHPIFAEAFHSLNPPYPQQQSAAIDIPAYSGVCGHDFVDFPQWPEELQGGFFKARYKPTNRIEFHTCNREMDSYSEEYQFDLIFSTNLSFIPVDLRFGPGGALYICDWYNPVKGHAQYSLRDPRRDRDSGRIWRVLPKDKPAVDAPKFAGASTKDLLERLKLPQLSYRKWARRELLSRDRETVLRELDLWVEALDKADPRLRHHQIEAVWVYRGAGTTRPSLLEELLVCDDPNARAAATKQLRHWHVAFAENGNEALARSAADEDGIVRLEALVAATWFGTEEALEAITPAFDMPMGAHLKFAANNALISDALDDFVTESFLASHPAVKEFSEGWTEYAKKPSRAKKLTAEQSSFDNQKGLRKITIGCLPERMLFDTTEFRVKAGQPVRLKFENPDATQHNLVFVEPGAVEEIGMAANEMAKNPGGMKKGFIPKSSRILHHTKLLDPNESEVLRFVAPAKPGVYPYLCTFPGHWIIMKGEMVVE